MIFWNLHPWKVYSEPSQKSKAFDWVRCLTVFRLRLPANIRQSKNILKTSWRCLEDIFSAIFFVFQDVLKTSPRYNCKTSWRKRLANRYWRRFRRQKIVMLKISSRSLEDVLENKKCLLGSDHKIIVLGLPM